MDTRPTRNPQLDRKTGWPKLCRDWAGRYVRLLRVMTNGAGTVFEAGEILYVERRYNGLELRTIHTCPECKRRYQDTLCLVEASLRPTYIDLLPEDYRPEEPKTLSQVYEEDYQRRRVEPLAAGGHGG